MSPARKRTRPDVKTLAAAMEPLGLRATDDAPTDAPAEETTAAAPAEETTVAAPAARSGAPSMPRPASAAPVAPPAVEQPAAAPHTPTRAAPPAREAPAAPTPPAQRWSTSTVPRARRAPKKQHTYALPPELGEELRDAAAYLASVDPDAPSLNQLVEEALREHSRRLLDARGMESWPARPQP